MNPLQNKWESRRIEHRLISEMASDTYPNITLHPNPNPRLT
jgi:hypothetical protein